MRGLESNFIAGPSTGGQHHRPSADRPPRWMQAAAAWATVSSVLLIQEEVARHAAGRAGLSVGDVVLLLEGWGWWCLLWAVISRVVGDIASRHSTWQGKLLMHFAAAQYTALAHGVLTVCTEWITLSSGAGGRFEFADKLTQRLAPDLVVYIVLAIVAYALLLERRAGTLATDAAELRAELAHAQLDALRGQLHPHFLFNALQSIAGMVTRDGAGAQRMLSRLGELLRFAVKASATPEITLRDEMLLVERYVDLQRMRFEDRLQVTISVTPDSLDALVPALIFQPLVENAIHYAVEPRAAPSQVEISACRAGDVLRLKVRDDGQERSPDDMDGSTGAPLRGVGAGVGLRNTRERLQHLYGERGCVELRSLESGGHEVLVELPWHVAPTIT